LIYVFLIELKEICKKKSSGAMAPPAPLSTTPSSNLLRYNKKKKKKKIIIEKNLQIIGIPKVTQESKMQFQILFIHHFNEIPIYLPFLTI
jgi:hypothetical protein